MELWNYFVEHIGLTGTLFMEHIWLVIAAVVIALVVGVSIGVLITFNRAAAQIVLGICQILMTVPSLALLGLLLPLFGIGFKTGMIGLILYSLLPLVRNTYTGLNEIDPSVLESARGMGMSDWAVFWRVKLPLAAAVILAGVRTSTVMIVGIAAIASYIGAGGLGYFIFRGINKWNTEMVLVGAIGVSILAVSADLILKRIENKLSVE